MTINGSQFSQIFGENLNISKLLKLKRLILASMSEY